MTQRFSGDPGVFGTYRRALWWSMDRLGLNESVEKKIMGAVTIQFIAAMSILLLPIVFLGPAGTLAVFPREQMVATVGVVALATLAYGNTILVAREDVVEPLEDMTTEARALADGDLTGSPTKRPYQDEIGQLSGALAAIHEYLSLVTDQAAAIQREAFDDPILDESPPGELGASLNEMAADLEDRTKERKQDLRSFKRAIDQSGHPIVITGTDGSMEYVNPAFEELSGYDREEALGRDPNIVKSGEHDDEIYADLWETITSGEVWRSEMVNEAKDGRRYVVDQTIAPVNGPDGAIEGYVAIKHDVTDRKQYEAELEQKSEQLQALNRVVTHDIANDLSVITGWLDVVANEVESEEGQEAIEVVTESTYHIDELIDIVRDFMRAMEEGVETEQAMDLEAVLPEQIEKVRDSYPHADITVKDVPQVTVEADKLLSSVFQNLLRNGIQHNDTDDPSISVSTKVDDETVTVSISDNGPGVPDDVKREIFGKDEKGLSSEGTGVGLYLVHTLTEKYGGEAWVEDNEPRGAVFKVSLPRVDN